MEELRPADIGAVTPDRLAELFRPRSVALVGATDRSMWSRFTFQNLRTCSPHVAVHCVHPRHDVVHGEPAHRSITAIGEPVDLAYIMVPTTEALSVLEEAAEAGVRNAVVLTAGFAESGETGRELQERLVALARERDLVLLGPNGNGFINATERLAPYGLPIAPPLRSGPLGVVLQSGGLASVVLAMANARNVGLSHLVATGNEAMVTATDVLAYLVADESTSAIAAFLEGIRDPDRFRDLAEAALAAGKPVVVLKVGRSAAGERAALAHTGAVAGDDAVVRAALRQLGVIQVDSLEDMLTTAGLLAHERRPLGRRLAAITASGGACDLIADRATDEGIELPEFPPATLRGLAETLPAFSNPHNPLDVTGYVVVDPGLSLRALETVVNGVEDVHDTILHQVTVPVAEPLDPAPIEARYRDLAALVARSPVPVVLQTASSNDISPYGRSLLDASGLHAIQGIEHGMTAIGRAVEWHERRERILARSRPALVTQPAPGAAGIEPRTPGSGSATSEAEARAVLAAAGVQLVPARLVTTPHAAALAAAELGLPAALKVVSPDVAHKSDVGGVALDLRDADGVAEAFVRVTGAVRTALPGARVEGALVSPMRPGGVQLLVSVRRDPAWGPVLAIGLGGLWVEVLADVSLRLLPVNEQDVREALGDLRGASLLRGGRGQPPVSLPHVADAILGITAAALGLGDALDTLEVNPLWASGERVEVLDALIVWR